MRAKKMGVIAGKYGHSGKFFLRWERDQAYDAHALTRLAAMRKKSTNLAVK